ncbi:sugar phosphate isomerase/epimerase [Enterococcus sp. BWB1-3]|uniref:sugar phosphate isomerase/epimerase family protein n=1 Tax=Enterococcus sp. BWB1-3 TaxID=2787713 RepID=UPI001920948D|nr:sugar phosphate isomerase/epimerase family protein [Enterococcus sp. BWB1-3]MBL1230210.1 sugar phosphate isomerase/epimerase [Enterococcus sp. BWB1-3]
MLPLNLGIRAHDITAASREELGEKLLANSFSHIQLAVKKSFPDALPSLDSISSGTGHYFGDYFSRLGIKVSVLGCYVNLASPDITVRTQAINDFKQHIAVASSFQAAVVGTETGSVGTGYTTKNYTEDAYRTARQSVAEMVAYAESLGVTVGIEAGINHPLHTADLAKRLIQEIQSPNLRIIMDCANLISVENYHKQEEVINQALNQLRDDICSMHLKDFVVENGQIKIVPVGTGWMNYEQILKFLKYDKPLMFASLEATPEKHLPRTLEHLKEMYKQV